MLLARDGEGCAEVVGQVRTLHVSEDEASAN
jgi:hypothetical protein